MPRDGQLAVPAGGDRRPPRPAARTDERPCRVCGTQLRALIEPVVVAGRLRPRGPRRQRGPAAGTWSGSPSTATAASATTSSPRSPARSPPPSTRPRRPAAICRRRVQLEVSSPGVDRPLTLPRHWRRNVGRLVKVTRPGLLHRPGDGGDGDGVPSPPTGCRAGDVRRTWARPGAGRVHPAGRARPTRIQAGVQPTGRRDPTRTTARSTMTTSDRRMRRTRRGREHRSRGPPRTGAEREIPVETILAAIETALLTAYRHTEGAQPHARVEIDRKTGVATVLRPGARRRRRRGAGVRRHPARLRPHRRDDRQAGDPAAAAGGDRRGALRRVRRAATATWSPA